MRRVAWCRASTALFAVSERFFLLFVVFELKLGCSGLVLFCLNSSSGFLEARVVGLDGCSVRSCGYCGALACVTLASSYFAHSTLFLRSGRQCCFLILSVERSVSGGRWWDLLLVVLFSCLCFNLGAVAACSLMWLHFGCPRVAMWRLLVLCFVRRLAL